MCVRDQVHYRSSSIFQLFKKKKVRLFTTQRQNFLTRKRELLLFFKKEGLTKMASGGILTTVGPSLIVWKVGPLLLNQINTLCTHTHRQYIQTAPSVCSSSSSRVSRIFPSRKEQTIGIRPQMTLFF